MDAEENPLAGDKQSDHPALGRDAALGSVLVALTHSALAGTGAA